VQIRDVTEKIADSLGMRKARGALVDQVYGNGPARAGGIKAFDVIVEFDGHDISDARELSRVVADTPVGKDVQVVVIRAGHEETMTIKVRAPGTARLPGALAAGTCDWSGYALGYDNFDAADAAALEDCARNGDKNCKVILNIQGNCAAFAADGVVDSRGNHICSARGWANGSEQKQAEETALAACAKQGGRHCQVIQSICDVD
jgi:membrane-associated protease RseP (regulator of RpoE activity)